MDHGIPLWPFVFSGLGAFVLFGLTSDQKGKKAAWLRVLFLGIATAAAFAAGILLLLHEPWGDQRLASSEVDGRRAAVAEALNFFLSIGPQLSGLLVLAFALYCAFGLRDQIYLARRTTE